MMGKSICFYLFLLVVFMVDFPNAVYGILCRRYAHGYIKGERRYDLGLGNTMGDGYT